MDEGSSLRQRRFARFHTQHPVEGTTRDRCLSFRGSLWDLSQEGCRFQFDSLLPQGTALEARCNISGLALRLEEETVWGEAMAGGFLHGVAITGFTSEADAVFHRLYIDHLAREVLASRRTD
jgi:hypothetical protein